jgi:hypothetical protein
MNLGNFAEAAPAFEQLAAAAEKRGGPRTPFLFLQAGRARLELNQNSIALSHLRHGLELFAASQRNVQLFRAGNRVISELKAHGLDTEAGKIAAFIRIHIPAFVEDLNQKLPASSQAALPTHCPSCGAPLRSNDVEWIDSQTAECSFCGSPVRAG